MAASLAVSLYKINILGDKFRHVEFTLERWNRCSFQTRAKLVFKSLHCHQQRDGLRPACVHINNSKYFPASAEHSFLHSLSQQLGNTQHTFIYKQWKAFFKFQKELNTISFSKESLKSWQLLRNLVVGCCEPKLPRNKLSAVSTPTSSEENIYSVICVSTRW